MKIKTNIIKLSALTLALSSVLTCAQAAKVYESGTVSFDIYGQAEIAFANADTVAHQSVSANSYGDNSMISSSYIGIAGRSQIYEGLDAIMMGQWDFKTTSQDNDSDDFTSDPEYLFVGIDTYEYGTLLAGKSDSAFYAVAGATDIYNYFDPRANDYYVFGDQVPGQIMYVLSATGFDLRLSYTTRQTDVNGTYLSFREQFAATLSGQIGNITLAYGINYTDLSYKHDGQNHHMTEYFTPILGAVFNIDDSDADALYGKKKPSGKWDAGFALSYGVVGQGFYGAFVYTVTDYDYIPHRLYTYDFASSYTFDNGFGLLLGYGLKTYDDSAIVSDLTLGAYYNFNRAFKVYFEVQLDMNASPEDFYGSHVSDNIEQDKFVIGAQYNF